MVTQRELGSGGHRARESDFSLSLVWGFKVWICSEVCGVYVP